MHILTIEACIVSNRRPCSAGCFLAYKPAMADLLLEKNTIPRLISRADKLSRTGGKYISICWVDAGRAGGWFFRSHLIWLGYNIVPTEYARKPKSRVRVYMLSVNQTCLRKLSIFSSLYIVITACMLHLQSPNQLTLLTRLACIFTC
jgi:hypothetical protein